ncbi:MAG: DUF6359 domain-containing protein [Bacteroidales bacterium]
MTQNLLKILSTLTSSLMFFCLFSCDNQQEEENPGELRLSFNGYDYKKTKVSEEIPDTNDFILDIRKADGEVIYSGSYGDSPESFETAPGNYTVTVVSETFSKPQFASPQYGDTQVAVVTSGKTINVVLSCTQLNCGIKLNIASNFLTSYPHGVLFVKSDDGKLMYSYSEDRIAYFNPGKVALVLNNESKDETLFSRTLKARDVLVVGLSAPSKESSSNSVRITLDTSRLWQSENYVIGDGETDGNSGKTKEESLSVAQAKAAVGAKGVWVHGYIVGGDLSSSGISFEPPFKSASNLAIASRSSADDKSQCLSVQVSSDIRAALNLVDNPELIGERVFLQGDIVASYFGIVGIKEISEYELR